MSSSLRKYRRAFYASQRFFDRLQLDTFPINPFKIFVRKQREPIFVETLRQYNLLHELHPLSIKDAKCFYYVGKAYLIVYNDEMPKNRIRFSLIHELAHIILGHLNDERTEICRGENVYSRLYCIMEGEANTFAGNFLAPPILIKEKLEGKEFSFSLIESFFGLSGRSVCSYRYTDYKDWLNLNMNPTSYEVSILNRCRKHLFPKFCMSGNEVPFQGGEYCAICGAPLYNRCSSTEGINAGYDYVSNPCEKGKVLPGNARYCPYCGNETTYFQHGLLKSWNEEYKNQKEANVDKKGATRIIDRAG